MVAPAPSSVFEISWEICNKVGGIYQVVRSKAELMKRHYQTYVCVGPYKREQAQFEFQQLPVPPEYRQAFGELEQEGISCLYGKWLIRGEPATILINCEHERIDENAVKTELWERYRVDSLNAHWDYDEPLQWAWAAGKLVEKLSRAVPGPVVAHAHEWLAGFAILYLRSRAPQVGTVFTTHATMLGRSMAGSGRELYGALGHFDPEQVARELGVTEKFTMERACAQHSHVFTTVSEITGVEATDILGRKPDVLLLNGLDDSKFPTFEEASVLHQKNREKIRDFLEYYFFSHYTFDLDDTCNIFITGRQEFHNKGIDILIRALGKLNQALRAEGSRRTVIAFFWIPADVRGIKTEILEEKSVFTAIQQYIGENAETFSRTILRHIPEINEFTCERLLSPDFVRSIQRQMAALKRDGNAPLCTHNLPDEDNHQVIKAFREAGLFNSAQDPVKAIFYPVYLTGSDGLLDMTYNDALSGTHLGVFPSYYEPWGYTPVESMAFGVPAVTTDLAGFGRFIEPHAGKGVFVVHRFQRSDDEATEELFHILLDYAHKDKFARNEEKTQAKSLTKLTDWSTFVTYYFEAHQLAVERAQQRNA